MANRYIRAAGGNYNAAGTWESTPGGGETVAVPTASDDVIGTALSGQLTITATALAKTVDLSLYTATLTHNAFNWTISGSCTFGTLMTYTPLATSTITVNGSSTFTTAGKLLPNFTHSGSTFTMGDDFNFMDSKVLSLTLSATTFNQKAKNINGFSATSRILIKAVGLGIARTLTVTSGTYSNADFRDITFSSASSLDLSAITGNSGDCGGNTITGGGSTLTFTTGATQTATGSSANYSTATWSGRVPLPQDDVVLSLTAGQTLTNDMPRMGKSISATTAMTLAIGSISQTMYGSLNLTNLSSITGSTSFVLTFEGRSSFTLTTAGKTIPDALTISMVGGTLTPQDALTVSGNFTISTGTFDVSANNFSVSLANFTSSGASATTNMGSSTWTVSGSFSSWNITSGTLNSNTSQLTLSGAIGTFTGGSKTYNNVTFNTNATVTTMQGSNTFNTLTLNSPRTLKLTSGTTQTVSNFVATGTAGNLITLNATTLTTTPPIITKTGGGTIQLDYVNIQGVNVTPTSTWYYGNNSNDGLGLNFGGQAATGDYVSAANSASGNQIFGATSYSVEVWGVIRSVPIARYLVSKMNATSDTSGFTFLVNGTNELRVYILDGTQPYSQSSTNVFSLNTLTHFVATWTSGSSAKIYVNGSEVSSYVTQNSVTTPTDDSAKSLIIGNIGDRTRTIDGQIYLTRLYRNVALSAANVTTLYNSGVMTKTSNPLGNATAEYLMTEGTGSTIADGINSVTGTITGADWANTGWNAGRVPISGSLGNRVSIGMMIRI